MMLAMVRNAVGQTATCLELPRQMAIALGAFWKAQYLCHTHIQFQVMFRSSELRTTCNFKHVRSGSTYRMV